MTIEHGIPTTTRAPGRYVEFNLASAQRGLAPLPQRMVIIAAKDSAGSLAILTPTQVFSEAEADSLAGQGSEAALMAKYALRGGKASAGVGGAAPEVWLVLIADVAGTAQISRFRTAAGTATESGDIVLRFAGRTVRAAIDSGDDQDAAATSIVAAFDTIVAEIGATAVVNLPADAELTAVNTGINSADMLAEVVSSVAGLVVTASIPTPGVGVMDITAAVDVLNDKDYLILTTSNHTTGTIDDYASHLTDMWAAGEKKFRFTVMAERGTLATAQTLATQADDFKQMVISAEGFRNTPGEIAAYFGAFLAGEADPAKHFNDVELRDLFLPDASDVPTIAEIETGIAGGLTLLSVNRAQTRAKCVRSVSTKVTENAVPFFAMLDFTVGRSMAFTATQVDIALGLAFARAKINVNSKRAVRSVAFRTLKQVEALEIIQNVDLHADELVVEVDPNVPSRLVVALPTSVVSPLNQIVEVINLLVE